MQNEARPEVPESNHLRSAVNEEIALAQAIEKAANNLARTSTSTKDASQDVPPTQEAAPQTPPSPKPRTNKPRELHPSDLRSERSLSGIQAIDDELTVNFDSDIADLQSQIYRLQERIKTSYPRMERLPYEVWKSSNKTTLRLWLKILTRKWERRFEAVGNVDDGDDVAMLLDEMVKAHKLDNDAAERMVQLYREIAEKRVRYMAKNVVEPGMEWLEEGDQDEYSVPTERKRVGKEGSITKARSPFKYSFLTGSGTQHKNTLKENTAVPKQQLRHYSFNPKSNDPNTPPTSTTATPKQTTLPHLTSTGAAHMVSVSAKPATSRTAVAAGIVYFSNPAPLSLIRSNSLKKGDVLSVARIAGIMAAKQCPTLIPLCHPIALSHAGVVLRLVNSSKEGENEAEKKGYGGVEIKATVQCIGPTGVEMEALTAVMGAALTVVDMCKAVDKGMRVQDVRVVKKEGGRSGTWLEEGWREWSEE